MRRIAAIALSIGLATSGVPARALIAGAPAAHGAPGTAGAAPRDVMFVGNSWESTATVVDARTYRPIRTLDMIPDRSERVRPMAVAPDERFVYLQVSFFHGFVEFDTQAPDADPAQTYEGEPAVGTVRRVVPLPDRTHGLPREQYVLDSAHHGLAIDADGTTLCAAGTMSDYAAVVDRQTLRHTIIDVGEKPYWATNSPAGDQCWVSVSGEDDVVVIDYDQARRVATVPVGDHPQRVRAGFVACDVLRSWGRQSTSSERRTFSACSTRSA
jgi:YVTN family beta-propeller protein